ncbi:MAG: GNAT family N-acetyltransferase [Xenococcaceae cyanobacterium]
MQTIIEINPIRIITSRLIQRDINEQDIPILCEFLNYEQVIKYTLSNNPAYIRQQLIDEINSIHDVPRYCYSLSVLEIETKKLIGHVVLSTYPNNFAAKVGWELDANFWNGNQITDPGDKALTFLNNSVAQIGWDFDPHYWNKGYATEAIQGAIAFAFRHLNVEGVIAQCFYENKASHRVMEKNQMKHQSLTLWQQKQLQECYHDARLIVSFGLCRSSWEKI